MRRLPYYVPALAVDLLDEIVQGAKITGRVPWSFLAHKSCVDQMFLSADYFALPSRETRNVELEFAVCLNFHQAGLCRPDSDRYQGSTENCLLSFPSFQCQETDNLFDVTLILLLVRSSSTACMKIFTWSSRIYNCKCLFFLGGGGGGHDCTCSFEDDSKIGRATKQPCSKKQRVVSWLVYEIGREWKRGPPTTQASFERLCFALTANVKLKFAIFLELMKPV